MSKPALDAALPAISGLFGDIPEDNPPGSGWVAREDYRIRKCVAG